MPSAMHGLHSPMRRAAAPLAAAALASLAGLSAATPSYKTFGTGRSAIVVTSTQSTVFEHTVGEASAFGVMTHFWMTGGAGTDEMTVRYFVDGEPTPSIEFKPPMAAGVGFNDAAPNWGNSKIGRGSDVGGWYVNLRIPFGRSIRVTLAMAAGSRPATAFVILRGCENLPVHVGSIALPTSARLRLHKIEDKTLAPFEAVPIVDLPSGSGLIYMHAIAAASASFNFWEGCYRLHVPHAQPFPGTVLSTGTEDYFDSAYGFHAGPYHLPVSGCTHRKLGAELAAPGGNETAGEALGGVRSLEVSAYRFHEEDPLAFSGGVRMVWRNGEYINPKTHPESPKCLIEQPGPGDKPAGGVVMNTTITSYAWVYTW